MTLSVPAAFFMAALLVGMAALLARLVHKAVPYLDKFFIPPAVTGGMILLGAGPAGMGLLPGDAFALLGNWPTVLVTLLFAGIVLGETRSVPLPGMLVDIIRQGIFVWFVCVSQLALGFLLVM